MNSPETEPIRVLLVESDPADARLVRDLLAAARGVRFDVVHAADLATARSAPGASPHAVILGLSDSSSADFALIAAALGRWPGAPVLVLTASADESAALRAVREGAQDCLVKGQLGSELLARAVRYAIGRARIEGELARERNLLRSLIDTLPDHIYAKDPQSRFIVANEATRRFFAALSPDGVVGKSDLDLFPRPIAEGFLKEERRILSTGEPILNREAGLTGPDGKPMWVLTNKVPLIDADGRAVGIVGVNRDVTDRKHAEDRLREANVSLARREQELLSALADLKRSHEELRAMQLHLVQAEKMESVGRLAAGVAHEVKNPLSAVKLGLEYLSKVALGGCGPEVQEVAHGMAESIRKAEQVIRGLLDFSAPRRLEMSTRDVREVVRQSLRLVRHELIRGRVTVREEMEGELPPVALDANKIEQVFVNLFINAVHAMPEGGTLTARTSARTGAAPTGEVVVEIEDTGKGIATEQLTKVFDPFYTTKPAGQGTGLGLTVCRSIVELHGGTIELANGAEGGARVTLTFNAADDVRGSAA